MARVRACFVVNPAAGRGKARRTWQAIAPLAADHGATVHFTEGPGHGTDLARRAADAGYDRVVAVGGDGTVSEVVNGLMGTGSALGIIPSGTGNDLCRTLRIPFRAADAAEHALSGATRPIDVGEIEGGRYFINIAGVGFDAEVSRAVNAFPKYLGGTVPYVLGILKTLWRFHPAPMEIDVDGQRYDRKVFLMAVGIAQVYGGGMRMLPDASIDDGLLDICIGGDLGRAEILKLVPKLYSAGHVGHPKIEFARGKRVTVRSPVPVAVHADGDLIGELPKTFLIHPGALSVVSGGPPEPQK